MVTTQPTLRVLCGMPGAGKSTWAAANGGGAVVLTADSIREHGAAGAPVFHAMEARARAALVAGQDVLIDACSLTAGARSVWLAVAVQCDACTELVMLCTPGSVCMERDALRKQRSTAAWRTVRAQAHAAVFAVQREGWHTVLYVPRKSVSFAYT